MGRLPRELGCVIDGIRPPTPFLRGVMDAIRDRHHETLNCYRAKPPYYGNRNSCRAADRYREYDRGYALGGRIFGRVEEVAGG